MCIRDRSGIEPGKVGANAADLPPGHRHMFPGCADGRGLMRIVTDQQAPDLYAFIMSQICNKKQNPCTVEPRHNDHQRDQAKQWSLVRWSSERNFHFSQASEKLIHVLLEMLTFVTVLYMYCFGVESISSLVSIIHLLLQYMYKRLNQHKLTCTIVHVQ